MARAGDGLGVVVDEASPERGGGLISLLGPLGGYDQPPSLIDFVSWEAPSWQASGVCPLGWTVIPPLTGEGVYTLVLFCAPQVRLKSEYQEAQACSGCHYPPWWEKYVGRVRLEIVRVLSPEEVPQIGERADYAAYLSTRYVDRANQWVDDPAAVADTRALISVTRTPLGVKLACGRDDWAVAVEATNAFEPSLVDFSLTCSISQKSYGISQTDVVLARTANTKVTGFQRYADQSNEIASFHQLSVWDEAVMRSAPERAAAPPTRRVVPVTTITQKPMLLTAIMENRGAIVQLAFSLLPVIGEALDVAELLSIALRRKDLQGDAAGNGQMALTAASLMTGPILEGPENARRIAKVAEGLMPVRFLDATGYVSLSVTREMADQVSPLQKAATKALSSGEQTTLARAMETAASSRAYDAVDEVVQASIRANMERLAAGPGLPAPIVNDAMRDLHPAELSEEFAMLDPESARALVELYGDGARKDFDFDVTAIARIEADFWRQYRPALDEVAVFRLLTPLGDDLVHPLLRAGFRDYKAAGGSKNAIAWLAGQSGKSRYRRVLVEHLGSDANRIIADVMGRTARRRGYRPTSQELDDGVAAMNALEARMAGAIGEPLPYSEMGELQHGFGHLLEADHLLEARFWAHLDGLYHKEDLWALFVPKNAFVREELAKRGWLQFDYDHNNKTQRMRQLIPHAYEDFFSTEEIYMAHWLALVDIHENPAVRARAAARFDGVLLERFEEMAEAKGAGAFKKPELSASQMAAVLAQRRAELPVRHRDKAK
ncbi:MAG: hypothetical protein AB7F36_13265 [Reyranellaceae bacterium]